MRAFDSQDVQAAINEDIHMQALRYWSFARILLVSAGWILLCLLVVAGWVLFQLRGTFPDSSGSGGIGAVSVGFAFNALILAIPVVPPILLILAWLIARSR
jgi:hypothetical protein